MHGNRLYVQIGHRIVNLTPQNRQFGVSRETRIDGCVEDNERILVSPAHK